MAGRRSPDEIKVMRRGDVRRAKLYYLRGRTGKAARIAEKMGIGASQAAETAEGGAPEVQGNGAEQA